MKSLSTQQELLKTYECPQATPLGESFRLFKYGKGSYVWGEDGLRYFDATSFFSVCNLGHNPDCLLHAEDVERERERDVIPHVMGDIYPSVEKAELVKNLCQLFQMDKAQLCITGSDAVEFALKTVELKKKKPIFLSFENSYHGLGHGALSVTNYPEFRRFSVPYATEVCPYPSEENKEAFEQFLHGLKKDAVDAVIIEPVLGRGGVIYPFQGALELLRKFCDERKIPLIFDEIFCGFYRTGKLVSSDVVPDLLLIGKALANGFPISCVLGKKEWMDLWPTNLGEALHTGTFVGHAESVRRALKIVACYQEIHREEKKWQEKREALASLMKSVGGVGRGFFYRLPVKNAVASMKWFLANQIIVLPADLENQWIGYYPPITTSIEDHQKFVEAFKRHEK